MGEFSKLLIYVPGVIIFLVGTGQIRTWLKYSFWGTCLQGTIVSVNHVLKKDKQGRNVYDYYNFLVEYVNPNNHHVERKEIKSPTICQVGQKLKLCVEKKTSEVMLVEFEQYQLFHPIATALIGALLIILAMEENQGQEVLGGICLVGIFLIAGISLLSNYFVMKKKNLKRVVAEVIELYNRQLSKETKIIKGSKYTYYPIVKYLVEGQENIRRCNINSSNEKTFQVGDTMDIYYDPNTLEVFEQKERMGALVAGIILVVLGVVVGASIVSLFI